jgi:hypothetical protein
MANPKSPIFATLSEVSNTLPGFRSLWTIPFEWTNSKPWQVYIADVLARLQRYGPLIRTDLGLPYVQIGPRTL